MNQKRIVKPARALEPWERGALDGPKRESEKAYEAFLRYRDMGASRSTRAAAGRLGKSVSIVQRWCSAWKWPQRARAWDRRNQEALDEVKHRSDIKDLKTIEAARDHLRRYFIEETERDLSHIDALKAGFEQLLSSGEWERAAKIRKVAGELEGHVLALRCLAFYNTEQHERGPGIVIELLPSSAGEEALEQGVSLDEARDRLEKRLNVR